LLELDWKDALLETECQLHFPSGIFVTEQEEVYFADFYNYYVRKVLKNGEIINVAGTGESNSNNITDQPATTAQVFGPYSVYVDRHDI